MTSIQSKLIPEVFNVTFDFLNQMEFGETLSSPAVTVFVSSGTDPDPSDLLDGAESVSGSTITQKIKEGLAGVIYGLLCSATGSSGRVYKVIRLIAVIDAVGEFDPGLGISLTGTLGPTACADDILGTFDIVNGYAPYGPVTVSSGALPDGYELSIVDTQVLITGSTTDYGTFTFTLRIVDFAGNIGYSDPQTVYVFPCELPQLVNGGYSYNGPYQSLVDMGTGGLSLNATEVQPSVSHGYVLIQRTSAFAIYKPNAVTGVFEACTITGGTYGYTGAINPAGTYAITCDGIVSTSVSFYVYLRSGDTWIYQATYTEAVNAGPDNNAPRQLSFSADGTKVLCTILTATGQEFLWTFAFTAGVLSTHTHSIDCGTNTNPYGLYSPNGNWIGISTTNAAPNEGILYTFTAAAVAVDSIVGSSYNRNAFCWGINSDYIYNSGDAGGGAGLRIIAVDETGQFGTEDRVDSSHSISAVSVSPNGDFLAVTYYEAPGYLKVYIIEDDGSLTLSQTLTASDRWGIWMNYL